MAILDQYGNALSPSAGGAPNGPDLRELGLPGTLLLSGFILEEQNPALQGRKGLDTYRAMGHDPTVNMVFQCRALPILSTEWRIDPADDSPQAIELADFAHYNLFEFGLSGAASSFRETIRQAVTGRDQYGFSAHEVIWRVDDDQYPGKVCIERLAWRAQWTRYKWNVEEVDMPDGGRMRQLISMTQWAPPFYQYSVIPADKMALFIRNQDGENFDGIPLSRSMYKPWWIRDRLFAIQSVGLERAYMGIPRATLPSIYTSEMKDLALDIVQGLRTHERAGILTTEDVPIDMVFNKLEGQPMQEAIQYLTTQICLPALAQFNLLGTGTTGSYALSSNQSELFLMALNADANYVEDVVNFDPVLPKLIEYNYPGVPRSMLPKLQHGELGQKEYAQELKALASLIQWGGIVPDDAMEDHLRETLALPPREGTITPEYLESLIPSIFPAPPDARTHDVPRPPVPPGSAPAYAAYEAARLGIPAPGTDQQVEAAERMERYHQAAARAPWRRPNPRSRMTDAQRLQFQAAERLIDLATPPKVGAPELPSVRAARLRRPYAVRHTPALMAETGRKKDGTYTRPAQVAARHKTALAEFIRTLGKSKAAGHVPIPKDATHVFDERSGDGEAE